MTGNGICRGEPPIPIRNSSSSPGRMDGCVDRRPRWTPHRRPGAAADAPIVRDLGEGVPVEHHEVGDGTGRAGRPRRRGGSPTRCPRCTPRTRPRAPSACSGRNGSVPGGAVLAVRRAGHGDVDRGERVGRADRPVAAHHQAGAGAVQVAEGVLPARRAPAPGTGSSGRPSARRGRPRASAGWRRRPARRSGVRRRGGPAGGARSGGAGPGRCRSSRRESRERRGHRSRARAPGSRPRRGRCTASRRAPAASTNEWPLLPVGVAAAVEVGLEHRGRPVLGDAVLHDLDGRGPEPPAGQRLAAADQVRDLLDAEAAVPPQRADDVRAQVAVGGGRGVRRGGVVHAGVGTRRSRPASS